MRDNQELARATLKIVLRDIEVLTEKRFKREEAAKIIDAEWPVLAHLLTQKLRCDHPAACEGLALDEKSCGWCADLHDLRALVDNVTKIYDYMTGGKVSKPLTLPSVVIAIHEDEFRCAPRPRPRGRRKR